MPVTTILIHFVSSPGKTFELQKRIEMECAPTLGMVFSWNRGTLTDPIERLIYNVDEDQYECDFPREERTDFLSESNKADFSAAGWDSVQSI